MALELDKIRVSGGPRGILHPLALKQRNIQQRTTMSVGLLYLS